MIVTVLKQSYNAPTYARVQISEKNSGKTVGLMNINAGTYWDTPEYPDGVYIVKVLELDTKVECEVGAQDTLIGVYFDHDDQVLICAARRQKY